MINLIMAGGPFMWLLVILTVIVFILSIDKIIKLFFKNSSTCNEKQINTILFWGAFGVALGVYAHFLGIYNAFQAISKATSISPAIIAGGYAVSLLPILYALLLFLLSAVVWAVLRWRLNKIPAA